MAFAPAGSGLSESTARESESKTFVYCEATFAPVIRIFVTTVSMTLTTGHVIISFR